MGGGVGSDNPPADGPNIPKMQKNVDSSDDGANTAQLIQNTTNVAVGTANTRFTLIAPAGWRREANTKRGLWYWRRGSGDLRDYLPGGRFEDLPEDLQQRSIEYGERQRQQKARAAVKRADRTGRG